MTIATETVSEAAAKLSPAISVSTASAIGFVVSDLVLWATLVYTALMIIHKLMAIYQDIKKEPK
jgi:hypothetical protein